MNKTSTDKELNKTNIVKELNKTNTVKKMNKTNTIEKLSETNEVLNNGSTSVSLTKWLKDLKCIINPINNNKGNNKCFQYSIGLSKHKEMGTNYNRINKIEPYLRNFSFENINYPLKKEDCEVFERNNKSISLNILKPDNERKKVYYHFNSKNTEREKLRYIYYF